MKYEQIKVESAERILTITLNRPERLNAYTEDMREEIINALDQAEKDDNIRAIIVTGAESLAPVPIWGRESTSTIMTFLRTAPRWRRHPGTAHLPVEKADHCRHQWPCCRCRVNDDFAHGHPRSRKHRKTGDSVRPAGCGHRCLRLLLFAPDRGHKSGPGMGSYREDLLSRGGVRTPFGYPSGCSGRGSSNRPVHRPGYRSEHRTGIGGAYPPAHVDHAGSQSSHGGTPRGVQMLPLPGTEGGRC